MFKYLPTNLDILLALLVAACILNEVAFYCNDELIKDCETNNNNLLKANKELLEISKELLESLKG